MPTAPETASAAEERFAFGANWRRYVDGVGAAQVAEAEASLEDMLGRGAVAGRTFLDAGCGSGLFSLAAARLGAQRIVSFDYDPDSVAASDALRVRWAPDHPDWTIEQGDALDPAYLRSLGRFDVVYSWGVLHHTGDMWTAIDGVADRVDAGGRLFIAIYNDQGARSHVWRWVKRMYNRLPVGARRPYALAVMGPYEVLVAVKQLLRGQPLEYLRSWRRRGVRGMSRWHDLLDWVGGLPFEVASPEAVFARLRDEGFTLERLVTCGGRLGCNEFVFVRDDHPARVAPETE